MSRNLSPNMASDFKPPVLQQDADEPDYTSAKYGALQKMIGGPKSKMPSGQKNKLLGTLNGMKQKRALSKDSDQSTGDVIRNKASSFGS